MDRFNILFRHVDNCPCNDCNFNWEESNKIIFSRLINRYRTTQGNGRMKKQKTDYCLYFTTYVYGTAQSVYN